MIAAIIRWSARNVFLVGLATLFVTVARDLRGSRVPLDAIPDLSDVAGHRLHRVSRAGAAGRRGPGHLSAHHGDADRAQVARRARLLVLRRVFRLRHLRGRHRHLLGALARARISELRRAPAAAGRDPEPRSRRHRGRLGLSICGARRADEASPSCARSRIGSSASGSPRRRAWPRSPASAASSSNIAW